LDYKGEKMKRENNPLVSIIVPCYNTPIKFFKECIQSIKQQSYKNIELIVIDDGSKGNYRNVYDKYLIDAKSYLVKANIYHIKNSGVSYARNYGIEKSTGEFISFIDSDDCISERFIETLVSAIIKYSAPVAACLLLIIDKNMKFSEFPFIDKISCNTYSTYEVWKNMNMGYIIGKLFRKECIGDIRFKVGMTLCEDTLFINQFMEKNPYSVVCIGEMYGYRKNPYSVTSSLTAEQYKQAIYASDYYKNVFYIKNNKLLYINAIRLQAKWIIKYLGSLVNERKVGWKEEYKNTRDLFLKETYPYIDKSKGMGLYFSSKVLRAGTMLSILYFNIYNIAKKYYKFFCHNLLNLIIK